MTSYADTFNIASFGAVVCSLTIQAPVFKQGGSDILQTQSANLATTITGRKITAHTLKTWIPARKTRRAPIWGSPAKGSFCFPDT